MYQTAGIAKNGYSARVSRLSNPKAGDGCGYIVKADTKDKNEIIHILEKAGINILGVERE